MAILFDTYGDISEVDVDSLTERKNFLTLGYKEVLKQRSEKKDVESIAKLKPILQKFSLELCEIDFELASRGLL